MALYPPPINPSQPFNSDNWVPNTNTIDEAYLNAHYCEYPVAQGLMNFSSLNVSADATVSQNLLLAGNPNVNYLEFPDGTQQFSAATPNLNTVYKNTSNTYDVGTIQTFQGSNSSSGLSAPINITNVTSSESSSIYLDPSPTYDLTLYTAQTGLTVRNPSYSFSINPTVGNVASFVNPISSTYSITGNSFGVSTTASQPYNLYTNTSGVDYGLVIANLSGSNGTITLSNNSTTFTTITSTSTGLTIGDAVNAGIITGTNFNMSFSSFFQSGLNTGINNNSANSSNPFIYFALNDTSNNQIIPLYIYYNSVLCNAILNMNYNNITNVNNLNFANGLTIQYDGYENYLYSNSSTNTLGGGLYFSCNGNVNGLYLTSSTSSSGRTIGLNAPINASFDLNMNNNDINNCNSVNSSGTLNLTGTSVLINGNAIPSQPTSGLSYPLISSVYVTNSTYPCTYGADQGVTYLSTVYNYNNQYIIINFQLYFIVPSNYPTGFNINPYQPAIFNYSTPLYPTTLTPTLVTNSISCINSSFSAYATSCTIGNITTVNPNIAYVSSSSIAFVPNVQTTFLPNQAYYIGGSITVYF